MPSFRPTDIAEHPATAAKITLAVVVVLTTACLIAAVLSVGVFETTVTSVPTCAVSPVLADHHAGRNHATSEPRGRPNRRYSLFDADRVKTGRVLVTKLKGRAARKVRDKTYDEEN